MLPTSWMVRRVLPVALVLVVVAAARGGSVMTLSPEAVLANSDTAFLGRVVSITPRWTGEPHKSSISTDYVFEVEDVLADDAGLIRGSARAADGSRLFVVPILGGRIDDEEQTAHGVPGFAINERAFIFTAKSQQGAICPTLGWWQGVYRIRQVDGREVVTHAGGCCASPAGAVVGRPYFSKLVAAPAGFTPAEFAGEVRRARPLAAQRPDLKLEAIMKTPEHLPPTAFRADQLAACTAGDAAGADPSATRVAYQPPEPAAPPAHAIVMLPGSPEDVDVVIPGVRGPAINNRYGFTSGAPDFPWRFNIAPNMGVFAGDVANDMGYWNTFVSNGVFYVYDNPTNTFNFGNDRNEVGFATDAVLSSQGGGTWGTSIGLCRTRSIGGEIKEADIYFNLNPGTVWTLDYATAFNSSAGMNNNPTLLFQRTAVHEIGHSFGLDHQWVPNPGAQFPSVMNYVPAWLRYDSAVIYADDANGIRAAYPQFSIFLTDGTSELWYQDGTQAAPPTPSNNTQTTNITPTSVQRGNTLQIGSGSGYFTVTNPGTTIISPRADWYLCPLNGDFNGSVYCGSSNLPTLQSGDSVLLQRSFIVPPALNPGAYYVGLNLVVNGDEIGWNNATWSYQAVTVTAAAPANDSVAGSIPLSCAGGTVYGSTFGATSSGYNACNSGLGPDVWYRIAPCASGTLLVDTCGSGYDTVVQILTAGLANIMCNDDAVGGDCSGTLQSFTSAAVSGGSTYYIRVAGYDGATGNFTLNVRAQPANDSCVTGQFCAATAVLPINANVFGTTLGATASSAGSIPACPFQDWVVGNINIEDRPDVWYVFDAPCAGPVQIDTEGSSFIYQVAVYSTCPCLFQVTPTLVACGEPVFGYFNPVTYLNAQAGLRYAVRVRGVTGQGSFVIRARYSAPDDGCDISGVRTAATLTAASPLADVAFNTSCATPSGIGLLPGACFDGASFDPGNDQFVRLAIETSGVLRVTRCSGSYLPSVALYSGDCLNGLTLAACGYSSSSSCDPIVISTPVTAGSAYIVRVAGHTSYPPAAGFTTLHFEIVPEATGACCAAGGACTVLGVSSCGGVYRGDGTVCSPNPCPQPTGACCIAAGNCQVMSAIDCASAGGEYTGNGIPCLVEPGNIITCCIANFNGEGGITVQDIFDFLAAYFAGDPHADLNGNGLGVQDIFDYLAVYFAGC